MTELINHGVRLSGGVPVPAASADGGREKTMAYSILRSHCVNSDPNKMQVRFDALISHDITYVGIIQTARASGLESFPIPYAMTNCHNSLCAVGGTINEDDHAFGLSAAKKYGGIFVPPNQAVIHQYARERLCSCGGMVLGSDSHTRYGCYGTMGVGEGGGELAKQLLKNTWDIDAPEVILVWLEGAPRRGVGPHDVAIELCGKVFKNGFVKNKVLEFAGPGVAGLGMDYRIGIDVMTTETSCLSSIWITDEKVEEYYKNIGLPERYKKLEPEDGAYYDAMVKIDLSAVECMIALPFHPSNAYTIKEFLSDPERILKEAQDECNKAISGGAKMDLLSCIKDGRVYAQQGVIVGCSGGMYDNLAEAAAILRGKSIGNGEFDLSVYPSSMPVALALTRDGLAADFMEAGAVVKPSFCGPCFGAGDTPANNTLSIRHATRNFANREGSKPGQGQIAAVALMDARSIAATALNGGAITPATDIEYEAPEPHYVFDPAPYDKRVYNGFGKADPSVELRFGPNITDWPKMYPLGENMLMKLCAVIRDPVTTTDELIPSGETSSYRSNPLGLAEFTLSRRVPEYVGRSKQVRADDLARRDGDIPAEMLEALSKVSDAPDALAAKTDLVSCVFANRPGDGSAREQAASCQKVLGGGANICYEYATKRYRSNCINWGILPFTIDKAEEFALESGDYVFVPDVRQAVASGKTKIPAKAISAAGVSDMTLELSGLTEDEKRILLAGCLINFYGENL